MRRKANSTNQKRSHYRILSVEPLETRRLLATLVNAKTVTYQDVDGDTVTVALSKAVLTSSNVNSVFQFNSGSVNADNSAPQQLQSLNLNLLGVPVSGANVTITAKRTPTEGDGLVNVGFINSTGINLGAVSVHGDLGGIDAGGGTSNSLGLQSLSVQSMGRFGLSTQGGGGSLESNILGHLGTLKVASDLQEVLISLTGPGGGSIVKGSIGSVNVGGSIIGAAGGNSGGISANELGNVTIRGSVIGGAGGDSGEINASEMGNVTVGGSVIGAAGGDSGNIFASKMGNVTVGGSVIGGGGNDSGNIFASTMGNVAVGGSVIGAVGIDSGNVFATTMGNVTVGGSMIGAVGGNSGNIFATTMGNVTIHGSLIGGAGGSSGQILARAKLGNVSITGDLASGTGSLSGSILSGGTLAKVNIGGSIIGTSLNPAVISAFGQAAPKAPNDLAIASLTVGGRVEFAHVLAGYDTSLSPMNADAQIGSITVKGDWIASDLLAGTNISGSTFAKNSGTDNPGITSSIGAIKISGQVIGTIASVSNTDEYGFSAELIKSLSIAGTSITLTSGAHNDELFLGVTDDVLLGEV